MKKLASILALLLVLGCAATGFAGEWTDQYGRKEEKKKEEKKPSIAIRNSVSDAAEYLAKDLMRRYFRPGTQKVTLATTGFIRADTKERTKLGADFEKKVTREVASSGNFEMVDFDRVLRQEQDLLARNANYRSDPFYIKKIGRTQGAKILLMGSLAEGSKVVSVTASLVDVESERTLSVSRVWVPKEKYAGDFTALKMEPKKLPAPFKVDFQYKKTEPVSIAAMLERELQEKTDRYKSKLSEEEVRQDVGGEAPAPAGEEEAPPAEEGTLTDEEMAAEAEALGEATPAPEEPAGEEAPAAEEAAPAEEAQPEAEEAPATEEEATPEAAEAPAGEAPAEEAAPEKKGEAEPEEETLQYQCGAIRLGERVDARFQSAANGFVFLFSVDETGTLRKIFPNEKNAEFSWEIEKNRPYLFPDIFTKTPGCKRMVLVIASKPFALDVDTGTLRRLACEANKIQIPVMKSFKPDTTFVQQTFCFTQEEPPRMGMGQTPEEQEPKTYEELMREKQEKEAAGEEW